MQTTTISSSMDANSVKNLGVNPDSILQKDDFLKLLITQLEYQDPTQPTDTEEILNQTSQLASLEAQQNTNKVLEELAKSFSQNKNFSAVSAIGKYAKLDTKIEVKKDDKGNIQPVTFNLNFDEDAKSGTIQIFDDKNRLVKTMKIDQTTKGIHSYKWDGLSDAGESVQPGEYKIVAKYINPDGVTLDADFGSYKIEAVKFEDSKTYVKINGSFIDFSKIQEIFDPTVEDNDS